MNRVERIIFKAKSMEEEHAVEYLRKKIIKLETKKFRLNEEINLLKSVMEDIIEDMTDERKN